MSSGSCKYTKSTSVNPLAVHCNDTSKHTSNLPPRLSFGYTSQSQSSRVKEEDLGSEIPHNTQPQHAHIHIHESDSSNSNDVLQLGPPMKPSVHSNIAARSKDALLRHQVSLYTTLHYTTLHYTTLHYTTLHYTTLHLTTSTPILSSCTVL